MLRGDSSRRSIGWLFAQPGNEMTALQRAMRAAHTMRVPARTGACACAKESSLLFVLANQKQRHAVLRSVGVRVKRTSFDEFKKIVNGEAFIPDLKAAIENPRSEEAAKIKKKVLPMLSLAGKRTPWSTT